MRALNTGKRLGGFAAFLFGTALIWGALFFPACETGFDPESSIPLAGPRSIQVTARSEFLVLQWTKVAPAQGVIPSYQVYYSAGTNPGAAQPGPEIIPGASNLVQAEIPGLENHVTYYVWVKAVYAGLGESDFSPIEFGIPIPPPAIPGPLAVVPGEELLQASWDPVADAFTYEVYYRAGGTGNAPPAETAMKTVSEPGAALSGLTNGTSYALWVRAVNTAGVSPGYATGAGTPLAASGAPATPPGKLEVTPGNRKLTLVWTPVPGIPSYKLYYGTTENFAAATAVAALVPANVPEVRADISGLANGTAYYVWVQSWNEKFSQGNGAAVSPAASGTPVAKPDIAFNDLTFVLGQAAAEYVFAQDLPPSVFFPDGGPNTDRLTRVQETALGDLFTDAAAWYVRDRYPGENVDFVFLNGGYIDNALPKGTITVGSLSSMVKPDSRGDKFVFLTLTGAELKKFFEDLAARPDAGDVSGVVHTGRGGSGTGEFGMVSQEVRYTLQYYKPPEGTTKISSTDAEPYYHGFIKEGTLKLNGQDLVDARDYRICTTDYVASGVYFTILAEKGKDKRLIDLPFWRGVAEYIYDQGVVTPALDGRIKVEGGVPLPPPWIPGDLIKSE